MVALAALPLRMSVDEFLAWAPASSERYQLVDGVPHAMAQAGRTHGKLQAELARVIGNHLVATGASCDVFTDPGVVPRLLADHNMRVPDLAVACSAFDREEHALTDLVLIVEILSPSNQPATWTNVCAYTSIPSVQEILVLRSDRVAATLMRRDPEGAWPERPAEITDGVLELSSIGFSVEQPDLYARTRLQRS